MGVQVSRPHSIRGMDSESEECELARALGRRQSDTPKFGLFLPVRQLHWLSVPLGSSSCLHAQSVGIEPRSLRPTMAEEEVGCET